MKTIFVILLLVVFAMTSLGETVVFVDKDFPSVDNGTISRALLEQALAPLKPRFVGLTELQQDTALAEGDLLVLPYGSAFPIDAWTTIRRHLDRGNLLVIGGKPFWVPVRRDKAGWQPGRPQNTYALSLGIAQSYAAPQHGPWTLRWDEDTPWFRGGSLDVRRVFVNAGFGGKYRGVGFLVDPAGNRLAAPVAAEDLVGRGMPPRRRVYLSFDAEPAFWNSANGIELIRKAALYASCGGVRLWLDLDHLTLGPGGRVTGAVDVLRANTPAQLTIELLSGGTVLASRTTECTAMLREEVGLVARRLPPCSRAISPKYIPGASSCTTMSCPFGSLRNASTVPDTTT